MRGFGAGHSADLPAGVPADVPSGWVAGHGPVPSRRVAGSPAGRRTALLAGALLAIVLAAIAAVVPVPFVALGPGPTFNTLGEVEGTQVVSIEGTPTFPTAGNLNMTTISVAGRITALEALGLWLRADRRLVPRDTVFPPGLSSEEVDRRNAEQFSASETNAELAALTLLALPTRITVGELVPDSPAQGALQPGDELLAVAGRPVTTPASVTETLADTRPGQAVEVRYRRGSVESTATVTLGSSPDREQGLLGIRPAVEPRDGNITISLGDVGGPSAGLMFALAVVDKLTPGELNNGQFIAGTGSIDAAGKVGPIGGIPFKMQAAREAGASVFLVPADNCAEALGSAPAGLQLVKVADLAGAVGALESLGTGGTAPACTP